MFALTVRDHIMIAHSFRGEIFGPAQRVHGATFIVDLELRRRALDSDGLIADIGALTELLKDVLRPINYRNLDELPEFSGQNTTTEFLAKYIHDRASQRIVEGALGANNARAFDGMKVSLGESHVAWASYDGPLH
jgi:6-pyruvoyltetrahydropterin/6-carboxytetrahydropterin synthase